MAKRVFLMDDSAFALELTRTALAETGIEVVCARDMNDLKALADQPFDLILLDVEMPEIFGDDVAAFLAGQGRATPMYLVSSLDGAELAQRAAECGAAGSIEKRLGIDGVVARVEQILGMTSAGDPLGHAASLPGGHVSRPAGRTLAPQLLLEEFVSTARGRIRRAEGALGRSDAVTTGRELHTLCGEASLLGQAGVSVAAAVARTLAVEGALDQVPGAIADIVRELDAAATRGGVTMPTAVPSSARVLLLDDSDVYRTVLMTLLENAGYEVVEARRLSEARHRMRDGRFDLAILDANLEDGRGTDLIPELRAAAPRTRLLLLSGDDITAPGADLVLGKSLPTEELLLRIGDLTRHNA